MKNKLQVLDIMVDLETLGLGGNATIIQIAAIPFNLETGEVFTDEFDTLINPISCVKAGLKINGGTVEWWLTQEKHVVEKVFVKAITEGVTIHDALNKFNDFLKEQKTKHNAQSIRIHSNGILADARWLTDAYTATGIKQGWTYYEDNDVRTLVDLGSRLLNFNPKKDMPFEGDKHVARQDVLHQIKYCTAIYSKIKIAIDLANKADETKKEDNV